MKPFKAPAEKTYTAEEKKKAVVGKLLSSSNISFMIFALWMYFNFEDVLRREVYYFALADSPIDVNALKSKVKKAQVRMSKGRCLMV